MNDRADETVQAGPAAVMNNLKTARRSLMDNLLLRTLMTICELGKEWEDLIMLRAEESGEQRDGERTDSGQARSREQRLESREQGAEK